jgi:poly-gamma-glutamate capsule biosynthesis protein CapA/YwtB (metallophosphatase superfamily)
MSERQITLLLCGDVMTGRGIDQILPHPNAPQIHEPYVTSALEYVRLAEAKNGLVVRPAPFAYVWGDALAELERMDPDVRIINLETAVTANDAWVPKGINYRMHPANLPCITAAGIDCCVLANNHVLDYGPAGLIDTVEALSRTGAHGVGAGRDRWQAEAPAVFAGQGNGDTRRVLVFAGGMPSSGIPQEWAAGDERPGINLLEGPSEREVERIARQIRWAKRPGDLVILSIHWGGNWGYAVSREERDFAHRLIEVAGVDILHGHSSHHPKGIEVHQGKLILYGCGDLITDYEGIPGYEEFRGELGLMYFVTAEAVTGTLIDLQMTPTRMKQLRLHRAAWQDALWLKEILDREGRRFGTWTRMHANGMLELKWDRAGEGGRGRLRAVDRARGRGRRQSDMRHAAQP